jgi:hypothetical protein
MEQETLNRYSCCGMIDGHGEILALILQFEPFRGGNCRRTVSPVLGRTPGTNCANEIAIDRSAHRHAREAREGRQELHRESQRS